MCIEPGETYEVLFKLKVGKVKLARSFIQEQEGLNLSGLPMTGPSKTNDMKESDASVPDQVNLLKKLYTL